MSERFLDGLEKALKEEQAREAVKRLQRNQERKEIQGRIEERIRVEKKWLNRLQEQSKGFYQSSIFPSLLTKLGKILGDKMQSHPYNHSSLERNWYDTGLGDENGNYSIYFRFDYSYSSGVHRNKLIRIECHPDGTIYVRGGWFNSIKLPFNKWRGDPESQEKALEKAYYKPAIESYASRNPPSASPKAF